MIDVKISTKDLFSKYNKEKLLKLLENEKNNQDSKYEEYKNNLYEKNKTVTKYSLFGKNKSEYTMSRTEYFNDLDVFFKISYKKDYYNKQKFRCSNIFDVIKNITDTDVITEISMDNICYDILTTVFELYNHNV